MVWESKRPWVALYIVTGELRKVEMYGRVGDTGQMLNIGEEYIQSEMPLSLICSSTSGHTAAWIALYSSIYSGRR